MAYVSPVRPIRPIWHSRVKSASGFSSRRKSATTSPLSLWTGVATKMFIPFPA